jgi:hypothetical protein
MSHLTRRHLLKSTAISTVAASLSSGQSWGQSPPAKRPKVAAIFTAMAHRFHAHVILENFLEPYLFNGKLTDPGCDVVSFYADQFPEEDMARGVAKDYDIPIFKTVQEALTLGKDELAVDAILLIGEHGSYPFTEHGVRAYPRKRLFDDCVKVLESSGRVVPMFLDKHFSYRIDWTMEMYETAKRLKIPLMAGSSVPLAERRPPLELKDGPKIKRAVSIHAGPYEIYDFHAFEVLQSMVESRAGGESGVKSIQYLSADELWAAAERGEWDVKLAEAALATELVKELPPLKELMETPEMKLQEPYGVLVNYLDGLQAITLRLGKVSNRFLYAHRLADDSIEATRFYGGPWENRNLFKALSHAIQSHFRGEEQHYPLERTLLTTVMTAAMVRSKVAKGKSIERTELQVAYKSGDWSSLRERGETWQILTEDMPQPRGITRGGHGADKLK